MLPVAVHLNGYGDAVISRVSPPGAQSPANPEVDGHRHSRCPSGSCYGGCFVAGGVIDEGQACIFVNGVELATVMCSPFAIRDLALGFLRLEGLIESLADVRQIVLSKGGLCADVWLHRDFTVPTLSLIHISEPTRPY